MLATAARMDHLVEVHARGAATLASELAPVSDKNEPGYVHMYEVIEAKEQRRGRWRIIVNKGYAIYVELGTVFMDAIPFFRPAIASARRALRHDLKIVKGTPRIS